MIKITLPNMTIKHKLTAIIMLTSFLALSLALCAIVVREYLEARKRLVADFFTHAAIIADNSKAAITFTNQADAEAVLSALHATRAVVFACIYDNEGDVFVRYQRSGLTGSIQPPEPQDEGFVFKDGYLFIFKNVVLDDETIGTICMQGELDEIHEEFIRDLGISAAITVGALLTAYFFSSILQKVISGPILTLAQAATSISEKKDYSIRVAKTSSDELGLLTDAFNKMLEQIQQRDAALTDSNEQLEVKVRERTADLTKEVTVRKEAEEKLKKERNFSRSIIETAQAIMLVLDGEGRIVSFNPYMEQLSGYPLDEVKGKDWFELFLPPRDRERIRKLFKTAITGVQTRANVNPIIAKDGREIEIEWYDKTLKDTDGNITGLLAIGQDITERRQKEEELRKTQEELIAASHHAGMAEVAADVLHNVGNVLNSVNVSTTLIHEALANSEIPNLKKVTDMIEEHRQDLNTFFTQDPKGRYVPSYLIKAAKLLANEQESVIDKLNTLVGDVNHIKTVIKMQQEYAKVSGVEISTTIDRIIEDAIRINLEGLKRHTIRIVRDYAELGEINIDKQRVMQILVNLIGNAKYALAGNEIIDKILKIRTYKQDENHLRIEVSDNGIGISRENLTKIFRHGFTTKKDGHGFGLHSGALAAKEMKGSLTAHSEGLGHGATFTLELPLKSAGAMQWTT